MDNYKNKAKSQMKLLLPITFILFCGFVKTGSACESINHTVAGRYLELRNEPVPQQKDLMLQTIQVHFPQDVITVGQAISYLLKPSGYELVPRKSMSKQVNKLLNFKLPLVDRNFGPMKLVTALRTLVGSSYQVRVNRVNRQIRIDISGA